MTVRERIPSVKSNGKGDFCEEKASFPKPLYVIIFSSSASKETVNWIIDLLERTQHQGGAELLVKATDVPNTGIILEISANPLRLLEAAEMMDIMKEDKNGQISEFTFASMDLFLKPVQVCKDSGIISQIFPLHEEKDIELLEKQWYGFPLNSQPLNEIRSYFGEAIGFYFAFLSYYTWALLLPAVIGIMQTAVAVDVTHARVFFAIVKTIWVTLFLECWKRRSNELAFTWGTLTTVVVPKLHPTFRGSSMEIDPVTKHHVPVYRGYKRQFKVYCVSTPIVLLCVAFAVGVMFIYFKIESDVMEIYRDEYDVFGWTMMQLPGVVYAVLVYIMSVIYRDFSTYLTEWENHKTQISFENHRVFKLLVFEFVNNFGAMFYIAFYMQDIELLKWLERTSEILKQRFQKGMDHSQTPTKATHNELYFMYKEASKIFPKQFVRKIINNKIRKKEKIHNLTELCNLILDSFAEVRETSLPSSSPRLNETSNLQIDTFIISEDGESVADNSQLIFERYELEMDSNDEFRPNAVPFTESLPIWEQPSTSWNSPLRSHPYNKLFKYRKRKCKHVTSCPQHTKLLCKICYVNEISILFLPCCHLSVCLPCSTKCINCPICRNTIEKTIRTYIS